MDSGLHRDATRFRIEIRNSEFEKFTSLPTEDNMKRRDMRIPKDLFESPLPVTHPLSDASKLLWERYQGPMNAAAQQFNAAIANTQNLLARIIIEREGLDPDHHVLDVDVMGIRSRPKATPQLGTP